ncbi:MAG: DNA/RNA nuclease SfsA [Fidelibacterota bacterium]
MKFSQPLIKATFIDRPNRFLTRVRIGENIVTSHLPDPGRLEELLLPGVELRVRREGGIKRKTKFTNVMVRSGTVWVSLVATFANQLAQEWIEDGLIAGLKTARIKRAEIPWENHRFDFLLERNGSPYYLEVKSVTWAAKGQARFPDAVSQRATAHVRTLIQMKSKGIGAGILFICQRSDVSSFAPMVDRDPVFAHTLAEAVAAGVDIFCQAGHVTEDGIRFYRQIPVNLASL